nr:hypothetical protein [Burkholderia multivorans]
MARVSRVPCRAAVRPLHVIENFSPAARAMRIRPRPAPGRADAVRVARIGMLSACHDRIRQVHCRLRLRRRRIGKYAVIGETSMLTAHEFAALFLVQRAPEQIQLDRDDIVALVERQLVVMQSDASGARRPELTPDGLSILRSVQRGSGGYANDNSL